MHMLDDAITWVSKGGFREHMHSVMQMMRSPRQVHFRSLLASSEERT